MNSPPTVFAQIMDFLPLHEFRKCVRRNQGDYKVKSFSCLDQFLCLAFAQLTYRESLRDIESCLRTMKSRLYHMGFRREFLGKQAALTGGRSLHASSVSGRLGRGSGRGRGRTRSSRRTTSNTRMPRARCGPAGPVPDYDY